MVQRGGCPFTTKVMHVQAAGAIAVILVGLDNKERFSEVMQIAQGRLQLPAAAALPNAARPSSSCTLRLVLPVNLCLPSRRLHASCLLPCAVVGVPGPAVKSVSLSLSLSLSLSRCVAL